MTDWLAQSAQHFLSTARGSIPEAGKCDGCGCQDEHGVFFSGFLMHRRASPTIVDHVSTKDWAYTQYTSASCLHVGNQDVSRTRMHAHQIIFWEKNEDTHQDNETFVTSRSKQLCIQMPVDSVAFACSSIAQ